VLGSRFIPNEIPSLRLFTGPKIILSKRNVGMLKAFHAKVRKERT